MKINRRDFLLTSVGMFGVLALVRGCHNCGMTNVELYSHVYIPPTLGEWPSHPFKTKTKRNLELIEEGSPQSKEEVLTQTMEFIEKRGWASMPGVVDRNGAFWYHRRGSDGTIVPGQYIKYPHKFWLV